MPKKFTKNKFEDRSNRDFSFSEHKSPKNIPTSFDYKDIVGLQPFLSETFKIQRPKLRYISAKLQRSLSKSIKHARFLALIPYTDQHKK